MNMNGFSQAEAVEYRITIAKNIMGSIVNLIQGMEQLRIEFSEPSSQVGYHYLRSYL